MERRPTPGRQVVDAATLALFVLAIALPLVGGGDAGVVAQELRQPAPRPERPATWAAVETYPERYEAWYGDAFGFRPWLLRWHNVLKLEALDTTPSDQLLLGRHGWLFTTRERSVEIWRGLAPFGEDELAAWQRVLEDRAAWCGSRGMAYRFAVAPNKSSIYPEELPRGLNQVGRTRLEQLAGWMEERSDVRVVDLRPALLEAKRRLAARGETAYYPLGTHWNRPGMLAGYRALLEALAPDVPGLAPRAEGDFEERPAADEGDNWGKRLYMEDRLHQRNVELVPRFERRARVVETAPSGLPVEVWETGDPALPSAVMFHDSFGNMQKALYAEHFRRIAFYYDPDLDVAFVERERPDVVVHLLVERALGPHRPALSPLDLEDEGPVRAAFEASERVLARLPADDASPALAAAGPLSAAREPDGAWRLDLAEPGGAVLLPGFDLPPGTVPVLRLELEAPADTRLGLEYQLADDREYSQRARLARRPLASGASTVWLRLFLPDLFGRLRLRPGETPGTYRLRALEVRAVPLRPGP